MIWKDLEMLNEVEKARCRTRWSERMLHLQMKEERYAYVLYVRKK